MRNFSLKFALLTARLLGDKPQPQRFMDCTPLEMLNRYRQCLSISDRGVLAFGFSDTAILALLDEEFLLDAERGLLRFKKTILDARSLRLAGCLQVHADAVLASPRETAMISHIAIRLLELTRHLYRYDTAETRLQEIRQEYEEMVRSDVHRYAHTAVLACFSSSLNRNGPVLQGASETEQLLSRAERRETEIIQRLRLLLGSDVALRALCQASTVDALFKLDAAKVLFGENSAYYQAWHRKAIFRHTLSHAVPLPVEVA